MGRGRGCVGRLVGRRLSGRWGDSEDEIVMFGALAPAEELGAENGGDVSGGVDFEHALFEEDPEVGKQVLCSGSSVRVFGVCGRKRVRYHCGGVWLRECKPPERRLRPELAALLRRWKTYGTVVCCGYFAGQFGIGRG